MADDATQQPEAESDGRAPRVPKPPRESVTIEGEGGASFSKEAEAPAAPDSPAEESASAAQDSSAEDLADSAPVELRPARRPHPGVVSAVIGAVVGAGVALGATWWFDPRADAWREVEAKLAALQAADAAQGESDKARDAKLAGLAAKAASATPDPALPALEKRLAKLEASAPAADSLLAAQTDARAAKDAAEKALALAAAAGSASSAPAGSAEPAAPTANAAPAAPDPRLGKLENSVAALDDRVAKLEAALAAPKSEARVAPSEAAAPASAGGSAAQAVAILALEQKLRAGEPFGAEFAALSRLNADPAALAALKPLAASGAPAASTLEASFAEQAPAMLASLAPESQGGAVDRLLEHMSRLVRVRPVGEMPGASPEALATQIEAALRRGQVGAAMAAYSRLPQAARDASAAWAKNANGRAAADAAARSLREAAIANLAARN